MSGYPTSCGSRFSGTALGKRDPPQDLRGPTAKIPRVGVGVSKNSKLPGRPRNIKLASVMVPRDVLLKIFSFLEPADILQLARTSKQLRKLLMTKSSISVWQDARRNVPRMPKCPSNMAEPLYAHLAFGTDCHFCGRTNVRQERWHWTVRLRACRSCLNNEDYFIWTQSCRTSKYFPEKLRSLLSFTDYHTGESFVLVQEKEKWREVYKEADNKEKWVEKMELRLHNIEKHTQKYWSWYCNSKQFRKEQLIEDRKHDVVQHITQTMGWADEYKKIPSPEKKPEDLPIVKAAYQNTLTPAVLSHIEPSINKFMEVIRTRRLTHERGAILAQGLPQKEQKYKAFLSSLPPDAPYPTIREVMLDPVIRRVVEKIPDFSLAFDWHSAFRAVLRQWQRAGETKLENLMFAICKPSDRNTALDLATAWFRCATCGSALRHPRALVHRCTAGPIATVSSDTDPYVNAVTKVFPRASWNVSVSINFEAEDLRCLSKIVELAGLDPRTATVQELDAINPIFECVSCNSAREGRAMMVWSRVLDHAKHKDWESVRLELVSESERCIVLGRMAEREARERCKPDYRRLLCRLCRLRGNILDLTKHVREQHARADHGDEDIVPVLDADHRPKIFWFWPPRPM